MRKLYLFLITVFCIVVISLVTAFFYIDTHRHHSSYYNIKVNGLDTSTVRLDKFVTEDKVIYRSTTETPFHSTCRKNKRKLVLDKRGLRISDYNKKELGNRASIDIHLKRMDGTVSFLAIGHSNFAYLDRFSVDKDFVLFEENALISYANIAARYDFKKKGLQKFQALMHSFAFLPPIRQTINLRLAGEEEIDLEGKKVDALQLILKLPDYKEASIWVNKWTHSILRVKSPRTNFEAAWTANPKTITAEDYLLMGPVYTKKEISFKNKDVSLSGTLTVPKGKGPYPAVLLIWGPGPLDRDAFGMFTNLADYLASRNIAVLSFDKRGIGKSQGSFSRFTRNDTIADLQASLDFLARQEEVDKKRIGILGHSEGGYFATSLAAANQNVSACIILAPMIVSNIYDTNLETVDYFNKLSFEWDKDKKYLADISRSTEQTMKIIQGGKDWILLSGKRVYLKKARLDLENKPLDAARKVKVPILILQGKRDTIVLPEHARLLEETLKESGNKNYKLVFFDSLGHFFGDIARDGTRRTHLTTDKKVMETIAGWLEDNLIIPKEEILEKDLPAPPEQPDRT